LIVWHSRPRLCGCYNRRHDLPPPADPRPRARRHLHPHLHSAARRKVHALGMALMSDPLLIVILGPTASGKTSLSLALAERFKGEIVSCDSVAVYRGFDVGTAKPSPQDRARAPHHLLDIADPSQPFTAGDYARLARVAISEISARGRLPIVVGGTGLYLRALLDGLFAGPPRSEELRERLRAAAELNGPGHLHQMLHRLDPAAAEKIHANDRSKLIRAIEVCLAARSRMTELWEKGRDSLTGFRILRIGLDPDRSALYERINQRASSMFAQGLVQETRSLREKYSDNAPPFASLGYKQAVQLLNSQVDESTAVAAARQGHRNYAKRQMTWFRRVPDVLWINGFGDDVAVQQIASDITKALLHGTKPPNL
jgi:tRNA dimethylallyltransferase